MFHRGFILLWGTGRDLLWSSGWGLLSLLWAGCSEFFVGHGAKFACCESRGEACWRSWGPRMVSLRSPCNRAMHVGSSIETTALDLNWLVFYGAMLCKTIILWTWQRTVLTLSKIKSQPTVSVKLLSLSVTRTIETPQFWTLKKNCEYPLCSPSSS